ncbi:MAG: HypC/HybG/HupF family hydrogenase formation chaperone [Firmicutes bacterium]|nr:HypC/HybG/HupF family hydrogenase formation chaperone [Bacillota bacterium]MBQ3112693.1 HypC/HybG/HupF family hydrogenase formation chaperone [Bacillota bacterium]MBQ6842802.1 HypC/HybG/HupF family hydrogenase formation chaperone [Bacillota bacterium]MBR6824695.1 HypC/HybG/HupF family hydrogenase formation chaperone [Bacillota bacterium]MBR7112937.1 HypC/HybG/HupF family hydrogenase formation chaperone [Bacillota bacterium]
MCIAIAGRIIEVKEDMAVVDHSGLTREVSLRLLPQAVVGDYVLVHAGFAIELISAEDGEEIMALNREMGWQ